MVQEEDSSHFHLWLFPRYDWMKQFGKRIQSLPSIIKWAQEHLETVENFKLVKKATEKLKD